ncbi:MAG: CDP-alcohol phosphatidyltransferase family protein [Actinobacteria bacterium]|nr:CDP-alcohol phosphatidyltransferase family protein [Actinomycetota bacterium]
MSTDPAAARPGEHLDHLDRVVTVPNAITLARLLFLPYYLYLLLALDRRVAAAALLAALGATDWIDGYIARHFHQASNLGRLMDPTVDRILFFVGIGGIIAVGAAPLWFCVAVLAREVVVATVTVILTVLGVEPVQVTWFGKAGTFCLMFAFPLFLAGTSTAGIAPLVTLAAWGFGLPGLALSYYAAVRYIPEWTRNYQLHKLAQARPVT